MLNKTKGNAAPVPSFVGAIKDVQVNKEAINLAGRLIDCIKGYGSIIYLSSVVFISFSFHPGLRKKISLNTNNLLKVKQSFRNPSGSLQCQ